MCRAIMACMAEKMNHILICELLYTGAPKTTDARDALRTVTGNLEEKKVDGGSFGKAA